MEGLNDNKIEPDDTYILKEDKLSLIRTIKNIYQNTMPWADDVLMRVLVKQHYNNVIENMDKEQYLNEIKNSNINNLLDYID
tara:strand:+ start:298 stop:543 length:246 start_codon:yes stop_codon:yes gene_type:complete